jgi:hypothetical protein
LSGNDRPTLFASDYYFFRLRLVAKLCLGFLIAYCSRFRFGHQNLCPFAGLRQGIILFCRNNTIQDPALLPFADPASLRVSHLDLRELWQPVDIPAALGVSEDLVQRSYDIINGLGFQVQRQSVAEILPVALLDIPDICPLK